MTVIINNINIYHIHHNSYHIDNRHNRGINVFNPSNLKPEESIQDDFIVDFSTTDGSEHPVIEDLEKRLMQSQQELKDLMDKLNRGAH